MANALSELSTQQLRRAVEIKEEIESLQAELEGLLAGAIVRRLGRPRAMRRGRRRMSAAARAAIAAAQHARWAKQRGQAVPTRGGRRRRRRMSAAARARISAAAKARWAKAKAAGKTRL